MSHRVLTNPPVKILAGVMCHWVVITWPHTVKTSLNNFAIGAPDSTSLLLGVLNHDAKQRFATDRPIQTSEIVAFDLLTMTIHTKNSQYMLSGPGQFISSSLSESGSLMSRYKNKVIQISRETHNGRTVH